MYRGIAAIWAAMLLTACATHSKTIVNNPPVTIKRIAIIPATNPIWYSFENAAPPIGYPFQFWVNKLDSKSKAKIFNDRMQPAQGTLGDDLTREVANELRGYGYSVEILQGVIRPPNEPDNVDYDKVTTDADAIVHVWISEAGMYSSHMSTRYIPRVNAGGKIWVKGQEDSLYNEDIYYGVDAKAGKKWAILPDPKYSYPDFDSLMASIPEVETALASGTSQIGKKISEQIYAAIK
ncbi:MAG TPA: hypothetical protein VGI32_00145 [Steroidobacteraceae bacterium]|jgi:hypothetical protein